MNAITAIEPPDLAERTARHMRTCAELAQLALQSARIALARAAAEPPPAAPADPPHMPAPPPRRAARPTRAQSEAPEQPETTLAALRHALGAAFVPRAGARTIDPLVLFARLAAIVRGCLALETRLGAMLEQAGSPMANISRKPSGLAPCTIAAARPATPAPPPAAQPSHPTPTVHGPQARRLCDTTSLATALHIDLGSLAKPTDLPTRLPGLGQSPLPIPRATDPPLPRTR